MKLRESTPAAHRRGPAFVTRSRGCGLEDVRTPVYNVSAPARELARLRSERGIGLRDAAAALGIRAVELSGLERGRFEPEDSGDWALMTSRLKALVAVRLVVEDG
jgi:hypothetical protein